MTNLYEYIISLCKFIVKIIYYELLVQFPLQPPANPKYR